MFAYQTSEDNAPASGDTMIEAKTKDDSARFRRPIGVTVIAVWYFVSSATTILLITRMPKFDGWVGLVLFTAIIGVGLSFGLWRMSTWVRKATIVCAFLPLLLDVTAIFPSNLAIVLSSERVDIFGGYWGTFMISVLLGPLIAFAIIVYMALPATHRAFEVRARS